MPGITIDEIASFAVEQLRGADDGAALTTLEAALLRLGVAAAVTSLDRAAITTAIADARDAGASREQIQEIISLVSGLGVHSLMVSATLVAPDDAPLSADQQALWDRHVGVDPYWQAFERECPGFLAAMLRLSSAQFVAFFDYCAVPWTTRHVPAAIKELVAMAADATPQHRFMPGFRLHLANALKLGVGRVAVLEALAIAAAAPPHRGVA